MYADSKDLAMKNVLHKVLKDKAYEIARSSQHDGYQRGLASKVCKSFDNRTR